MPKICVKWSGKKFDVNANMELEPLVLKSQLYELTGVLPEHQKVLIKGQQLKDDTWDGIQLQEGLTIMMIGSVAADVAVSENSEKAASAAALQDQSKTSDITLDKKKLILPVGLNNLGNTCYMNACFQAYKTIPELMVAIKDYSAAENEENRRSHMLITSTKILYRDMEKLEKANRLYYTEDPKAHIPFLLLSTVHNAFPQFSERDGHGHFRQQDANECFSQVLHLISSHTEIPVGNGLAGIQENSNTPPKTIKTLRIFETEFDVKLKCLETEEEPEESTHESTFQVSCFLEQDVRYIQSGIKNRLTEEIEKHSEKLNRNVKYQKKSQISRLPEYLCVQMVRFFYKPKEGISAKILKDVKFPMILDTYEMCTPELQAKLQPMRDLYKLYDDQKVEELRLSKLDDTIGKNTEDTNVEDTDVEKKTYWSNSFDDDPGSNNSGFYELKAIITHKGRSSDVGHYVAWVRLANSSKWVMCDDEHVHPVSEEDVLKLSGGGDWHCAYVLIYGPRKLPKNENSVASDQPTTIGANALVDTAKDTMKMELD